MNEERIDSYSVKDGNVERTIKENGCVFKLLIFKDGDALNKRIMELTGEGWKRSSNTKPGRFDYSKRCIPSGAETFNGEKAYEQVSIHTEVMLKLNNKEN